MSQETPLDIGPVLVTGGCGFIGSHIVEVLLERDPNCEVHALDLNTERYRIPGAHYHTCDITSRSSVTALFAQIKPRTVFHVACPESTVKQDKWFREVNVGGAQNLLEAARQLKTIQAFVNTSTSSVIHDNHADLIDADENLPVLEYPAQKRVYTLTKAEAETAILAANADPSTGGMLTVSLRPASVFGERDHITMGKIVANARLGKAKVQLGHGQNLYDFVYVANLADAHILAAEHLVRLYQAKEKGLKVSEKGGMRVDGECFNVTNGERILFWDFQRAIAASVGLPVRREDIRIVPVWVALLFATLSEWYTWVVTGGRQQPIVTREAVELTTIERTLNGDKAQRVLGYRPRFTLHEGLARAGKWFVEEHKRQGAAASKKDA